MPESFAPLAGEKPIILILGSMPGAESLRRQQYYAHPQNRFWRILFRYFDTPFSADYRDRISLAVQHGIALWDTIASCGRENSSLDARIRDINPNDIGVFLDEHPSVRAIFTNGGTSAAVLKKHAAFIFADSPDSGDSAKNTRQIICRALPSTSPANARMDFDKLYKVWKSAMDQFF